MGVVMKIGLIILVTFILSAILAGDSLASSRNISANIKFETALSLSDKTDISFGLVRALQPGTYTISTTGVVTASDNGLWLGGESHAGKMTIVGSDQQAINIAVTNYVADNGVTPSAATCSYGGGAAGPCSLSSQTPPGDGKPLVFGITLTVDGTQTVESTATPSFEVVVTYN